MDVTRLYTGQPAKCLGLQIGFEVSILFSFELNVYREGEGPSRIATFARTGQRQAFTPAVILFIALTESENKLDPG